MTVEFPFVETQLIAHRGASLFCPENTLQAVRKAARMGVKWIETDVQMTIDNQLVIIHDETLERTSNGTGFVARQTLSCIKGLDAGSWFPGADEGPYQIPTLEEFLKEILVLGLNLQLEIKALPGLEYEVAELVCAEVKRIWPMEGSPSKLMISSFSERSLRRTAELLPEIPRVLALLAVPADPDALARECNVSIIHIQDVFADDEGLARVRASNIEFGIAVIDDAARARYLLENGIQQILSDHPALLLD